MNKQDVERLAREAGFNPYIEDAAKKHFPDAYDKWLAIQSKFAALVLEEVAKNHDEAAAQWYRMTNRHMAVAAENLASDLRNIAEGLKP